MAEDTTPLLMDFNSAVMSYDSLMEELTNWVNGNDILRLDMNFGSHFTSNLQYAAGAKYGRLEFIFEQLKASGKLGDVYTRQNVRDALTALMDDIASTKQEVKDEMERLDSAFGFWREQIRDVRDRLDYVCDNSRRKAYARVVRRVSLRPTPDEEADNGSEDVVSVNIEEGRNEDDLDLLSTLRDVKRGRKAEDADGVVDEVAESAAVPDAARESAGDLVPAANEVAVDEKLK